jgi:hypothetical protein
LQSLTDHGWDWVITGLTSHSPNPSAGNIYGVTALGLLDAYKLTGDTAYFGAAKAVADHLVSLGNETYHYQFDLEFLIEFAEISGDASYKDFASEVWTWIKANRPEFADAVTLYNWYYTTRYPGSHGGAVWGTGDWAIAALLLGDTEWAKNMTDVIADNYTKILTEPDPLFEFQYVGWGKALLAFQTVDPTAYTTEIADIVSILKSDPTFGQNADGSFSGWVQDEAYVTMGLVSVGEIEMANKSAVWLIENQGYDTIVGGWKLPDGKEYSEVTSEAGQAIFRVIQAIGTVNLDHYSDGIVDVKTMTISQAVKAAYSGDTIIVYAGIYNEALYIDKSLKMKGIGDVVIKGAQMRMTNYGNRQATIFIENVPDVILEDFDIEGEGLGVPPGTKSYAVLYENSTGMIRNCVVSPNTIGDMYSVAIALWDNSIVTVESCLVKNFGRIGIYSNNATSIIRGNEIIGQVYSLNNQVIYGIEIEDYSGPSVAEITGNKIYNCNNTNPSPLWSSAAILVDGWREWADVYNLALLPSTVIITYNEIYNNYESIELVANEFSYARYNNFHHNTFGLVSAPENWTTNPTYYVFDARYNWWGDASGPYHNTTWTYMGEPYGPHYGLGDPVSDYVLYDPWLEYPTPLPKPTISVEPSSYEAQLRNEIFTINVTLNNLSVGWQVVGVEFKLRYNATLLEVLNVTEGPFLQEFAVEPHQGTYFVKIVKADYVHVGIIILPDEHGLYHFFPSGNGTLATITFKAVYQQMGLEKPPLSCNLELFDTIIGDFAASTVAHNTTDGYYEIPPTVLGDLNYDGTVNILDIIAVASVFGSRQSQPNWNPNADLIPDGVINILDIIIVARNLGQTKP